jgi:hypothetical protein
MCKFFIAVTFQRIVEVRAYGSDRQLHAYVRDTLLPSEGFRCIVFVEHSNCSLMTTKKAAISVV